MTSHLHPYLWQLELDRALDELEVEEEENFLAEGEAFFDAEVHAHASHSRLTDA